MTITDYDLRMLRTPFHESLHSWLQGNAYLSEYEITTRIEAIDPAWTMTEPEICHRDKKVTVKLGLTILGVTRWGVGQAEVQYMRDKKNKKTGEVIEKRSHIEANEAEKSAITDALKRASRMFGIGRYLLKIPDNVRDNNALGSWLTQNWDAIIGGTSQSKELPEPASEIEVSTEAPPKTNDALWWQDEEQYSKIISGAVNNDLTIFYLEMALGRSLTTFATYETVVDAIKSVLDDNTDVIQYALNRYYTQAMDNEIKANFKALKHFTNWLNKHYEELDLHASFDLLTFESKVYHYYKDNMEAE